MRILITGCDGMLGHRLFLALRETHETWGAMRGLANGASHLKCLGPYAFFLKTDLTDTQRLNEIVTDFRPQWVINAAGITPRHEGHETQMWDANAVAPHGLAAVCAKHNTRLIHFSSDCVFQGQPWDAPYSEEDRPDSDEPYGYSKRMGEPRGDHVLVLRTSFVGRELKGHAGLLDWFLSQPAGSTVRGWTSAHFTGLTTHRVAQVVLQILAHSPELAGTYHLAGPRISKFDLLKLCRQAFQHDVEIKRAAPPELDRSLDGSLLRRLVHLRTPSWPQMLAEVAADPFPYPKLAR